MSRTITACLLAATLAACGGSDHSGGGPTGPGPVTPTDTMAVASVAVTFGVPETGPGVVTYATAVLRNANGTELTRRTVTWASSNPTVARVDATEVIKALAPGTTTITATSEQRSGSATFTVLPIARVVVNALADSLVRGHGLAIEGVALDAQGQPIRRLAVWSSQPAGRVGFSLTGDATANIIGVGEGTVTISVFVAGVEGKRSFTVVPPVRTGIGNIHAFTEQCPTTDPAYATVRAQFDVRVEGVPVPAQLPCSGPFSTMPIAELTDELLTVQALRIAYHMSSGTAGTLPWTPQSLWEWMTTTVRGVNIKNAPGRLYCCDDIDGQLYISVSRQDANTRDIKRTWVGLAWTLDYFAHEIRHADGGPGHTRGCAAFPNPTDPAGCDATYDPTNLGSYGVQYWLSKAWATGYLDIGIGCAPAARARTYAESNWGSVNSFRARFVSNVPPELSIAPPYGLCFAP